MLLPPFVIRQDDGSLSGYGIDVWNAISARLKFNTSYDIYPSPGALLAAMRARKDEVVASPVVITSGRDEEFDLRGSSDPSSTSPQ